MKHHRTALALLFGGVGLSAAALASNGGLPDDLPTAVQRFLASQREQALEEEVRRQDMLERWAAMDEFEERLHAYNAARAIRDRFAAQRPDFRALGSDENDRDLQVQVSQTTIQSLAIVEEESLQNVGQILQSLSGLPILVDAAAEVASLDEGVVFMIELRNQARMDDVLELICSQAGGDVVWVVRDGAVVITTRYRAAGDRVLHPHFVGDLLIDAQELLAPVASGVRRLRSGGRRFEVDEFESSDDWMDEITMMVQEHVVPGSWDEEGVMIDGTGEFLFVTHDASAQEGVATFLDQLRSWGEARADGERAYRVGSAEDSEERDALLERLESAQVALTLGTQDEPGSLYDLSAFLTEVAGVDILVDQAVEWELDEEEVLFHIALPPRSVRQILDVVQSLSENLRWTVRNGVVVWTVADYLTGGQELWMYDVQDIIERPLTTSVDFVVDEELMREDPRVMDADHLEAWIREAIAPASWDEDPMNMMRIGIRGTMTVNQRPEVQAMILEFLEQLWTMAEVVEGVHTELLDR